MHESEMATRQASGAATAGAHPTAPQGRPSPDAPAGDAEEAVSAGRSFRDHITAALGMAAAEERERRAAWDDNRRILANGCRWGLA